jgi:hypothetical protein
MSSWHSAQLTKHRAILTSVVVVVVVVVVVLYCYLEERE